MRDSISVMGKCRNVFFALLAASLALCALFVAGCGSSPSGGASASSPAKELTPDEMIEQRNQWADEIVNKALDNLAAEGVIDTPNDDAESLVEKFNFEKTNDGYDIVFKDQKAAKELTGDYKLPQGKVVLCRYSRDMEVKDVHFWADPEYADGDWVNEEVGKDVPLFYPESLNGHFDEERTKAILANVPADTFANSFDECDYLVVYDSGASHVDENYYMGSIPRTSVTTLVLVIDKDEEKVVHIENLGTDTPGSSVKMGQERGDMLWDECAAYLNTLLTSSASR